MDTMDNGQPMGAGQTKESNTTFNMAVPDFEKSSSLPKPSGKPFSELGAFGIITQAHILSRLRFKFFRTLFFGMMFPMALFAVICGYIFYRSQLLHNENDHQQHDLTTTFDGKPFHLWGTLILIFFIIFLMSIACEAAMSLPSSAILYAVGLHYSGHDVSFKGVMRVCITSKWMRLTVTRVCKLLLLYVLVGIYLVIAFLHILFDKRQATNFMVVGLDALGMLLPIVSLYLEIIFMIADSVSALEKAYGWAAVAKSLRLLKEKRLVAVSFFLLWLMTFFLTFLLAVVLVSLVAISTSVVGVLKFVPGAIAISAVLAYLWRLTVLSSGIFYVSCKIYHKESLMEAIHHTGTALEYKRMKSAIFRTDSQVHASDEVGRQQELEVKVGGQDVTVDPEFGGHHELEVSVGGQDVKVDPEFGGQHASEH